MFLLLQIMLSHLSVVMLPVTITQIQTGPRLKQLRDATAGLSGCTELLSGNGSWCKHTVGRTYGVGLQTNLLEWQLNIIHFIAEITLILRCYFYPDKEYNGSINAAIIQCNVSITCNVLQTVFPYAFYTLKANPHTKCFSDIHHLPNSWSRNASVFSNVAVHM